MTETETLVQADKVAIKQVLAVIDAEIARPTPSESLVDAVASFGQAVDRSALFTLREAAQQLLVLEVPRLDPGSIPLTSSGDAAPAIDAAMKQLQEGLQKTFANAETLRSASVNTLVKEAADAVMTASRNLFDAAEAERWSILHAEAEADLRGGRTKGFESLAGFLADLHRE